MPDEPPEIRSILAKNLKEQRKKMGLSQERFAEISGLSIQTINDIEGCRKWVSDKTITKLSTALNLECYQLLLPRLEIQRKKEINSTRQLWGLMKTLKKSVDSQIISHFTDYLKKTHYNVRENEVPPKAEYCGLASESGIPQGTLNDAGER
jgi:transcriptional regulator with XRE-family HTH domain